MACSSTGLWPPTPESRFCATSGSEMDHQCLVLHHGARHHHKPAHRHSRKTEGGQARRPSKSSVQESCKEDSPPLEEEEPGRGGGGGPIAEDLHAAFTSFHKVLAALPRWVLASRTPFASFLAQTFYLQCFGNTPASVVYPLPLVFFHWALFSRGIPKLSRRRWSTLLKKRLRHIIIVALRFRHGGICQKDLHLLRRRPNQSQLVVHRRLWALLSMCDSPELHSVVPGRSGSEFIARLLELEHFSQVCRCVSL